MIQLPAFCPRPFCSTDPLAGFLWREEQGKQGGEDESGGTSRREMIGERLGV